jgi:outer membrane lipopolysaccharide assembly protein LptE/RlpB
MIRSIKIAIAFTVLISLNACNYSFTGASVPAHLKSISIPLFSDRSGSGEFDLGDQLTKKVIQNFIEDNSLSVSDRLNSDSVLDGTVVSFNDAPQVVSGGENVTTRRITLTVKVVYKDLVKKKNVFEKNFSNYGDYPATGDITVVRKTAIQTAIERISEDILLGVVSNW